MRLWVITALLLSETTLGGCRPAVLLFAHHDRLSSYGYLRRPAGYHWSARRSAHTGNVVYYGIDPKNGWTVYVGPDGQYYTFNHPGEIQPGDLGSFWDPHDAKP